MALNGEVDLFAPGFISPMKLKSPRIDQFHKLVKRPDGTLIMDPEPEIRTERTVMTGSRFPEPGLPDQQPDRGPEPPVQAAGRSQHG